MECFVWCGAEDGFGLTEDAMLKLDLHAREGSKGSGSHADISKVPHDHYKAVWINPTQHGICRTSDSAGAGCKSQSRIQVIPGIADLRVERIQRRRIGLCECPAVSNPSFDVKYRMMRICYSQLEDPLTIGRDHIA